jgi:hypothetical protein
MHAGTDAPCVSRQCRPFTWDNQPYVSFSHRRKNFNPEYAAIAKLDMAKHKVVLQHVFEEHGFQKNWGFFQEADQHLILHSTLPCTKILRFDAARGKTAPVLEACYSSSDEAAFTEESLLNISEAHNSAHPVLWSPDGIGEPSTEYLVMVHNRETHRLGGYNHWLLRMDAASKMLTHVSHGVVFGRALAAERGRYPVAVIVGSINVVIRNRRQILSIFGGQGDSMCVHDHVDLSKVRWLPLNKYLKVDISRGTPEVI